MNESELIDRIKALALDPKTRTSMRSPDSYPVATLDLLKDAESQMGFPLPRLLCRLYLEVGNGGFGPGCGLFGLTGGNQADADMGELTLPELYLTDMEYDWPEKLVSICNWGCCISSAIDCSTPEGEMVFVGGTHELYVPEGITFAQWMEDWVNGVDLFERGGKRRPPPS